MRDTLFIRFGAKATDQIDWLLTDASGQCGQLRHSSLQTAIAEAGPRRCIVLVPSSEILLTTADLPGGPTQRNLKALPWALEEQLAADVERLHFAPAQRNTDAGLPVAVVDQQIMKQWLARLDAVGLQPQAVIPDILCLPENACTLVVDGNSSLLRQPDSQPVAMDTDLLEIMLATSLAANSSIQFYRTDESPAAAAVLSQLEAAGHSVTEQSIPELLPWLVQNYQPRSSINLLQGDYAPTGGAATWLRPWKFALILLTLTILAATTARALQLRDLQQQRKGLDTQITQVFQTVLPGSRLVNARVQIEQALIAARGGSADSAGFTQALLASAPAIAAVADIQIAALLWRNGALEWQLKSDKVQSVDALKQQLAAIKTISAEVISVNAQGGNVDIRLRITNAVGAS